MTDQVVNKKPLSEFGVDEAVGKALRALREANNLTARDLASSSNVSAAMISRIENGQVSPSLSTLEALARALEVPIVSLLRETGTATADITHVKAGKGLESTRVAGRHSHDFVALGFHRRPGLEFEALMVTLDRRDDSRPPIYNGHGCLFVYALEGEAIYLYGEREIHLQAGDSLSLDAELRYGIKEVLTPVFRFLSVQASGR
ncbi:helix-turn-helix domain-containing protein [Hoeflea poritis]|uniref:XRE family transcriptional regulator n=1 Tax=Hoeflea poritis TaxID=2993659 RepID=A0ABT4VJ82_9HYPH|nr:XRE family transcriptional regulator [Hoeflea poritis]MDA4844736.1 XRE family transcriptional regulator [Hoeflea poritis]